MGRANDTEADQGPHRLAYALSDVDVTARYGTNAYDGSNPRRDQFSQAAYSRYFDKLRAGWCPRPMRLAQLSDVRAAVVRRTIYVWVPIDHV